MVGLSESSRKELYELLEEYELKEYTDIIEAAAEGYVYLTVSGMDTYATVGNTRIGGVPDLPPSMTWPKSERGYYSFVAQINLAELPRLPYSPLPKHGILYFFFGEYPTPRSKDDHRILYFDGDILALKRTSLPPIEEFSSDYDWSIYEPCLATITDSFALPRWLSGAHDVFGQVMDVNIPDFRLWLDKYWFRLLEEVDMRRENFADHDSQVSRMLGPPSYLLHRDLMQTAQLVREGKSRYSLRREKPDENEVKKWILLLELGSHDLARMQWSDMGFLDFVIHADDLAKLDFTRTFCAIASS